MEKCAQGSKKKARRLGFIARERKRQALKNCKKLAEMIVGDIRTVEGIVEAEPEKETPDTHEPHSKPYEATISQDRREAGDY